MGRPKKEPTEMGVGSWKIERKYLDLMKLIADREGRSQAQQLREWIIADAKRLKLSIPSKD